MVRTDPNANEVVVSVRIVARPETVYRFFSDPQRFTLWMGAQSSIELRIGGTLVVSHPSGPPASGTIKELIQNQKIVFTWGHRAGGGPVPEGSSTVTITLEPIAEGTRVTLRHAGLPTEADRIGHTFGWRHYLSQLSYFVSSDTFAAQLDGLVDTYLRAWSETEGAKRAALLAECWADNGLFRDRYACLDSRESLDTHISNVQRMAPGAALERSGPIEQCHAFARYPWRAVFPNGAVMAAGTNFFELSSDGKIRSMVGFWDPVQ